MISIKSVSKNFRQVRRLATGPNTAGEHFAAAPLPPATVLGGTFDFWWGWSSSWAVTWMIVYSIYYVAPTFWAISVPPEQINSTNSNTVGRVTATNLNTLRASMENRIDKMEARMNAQYEKLNSQVEKIDKNLAQAFKNNALSI